MISALPDPRLASVRAMKRAFRAVPDLGSCLTHYADITRSFSVRVPCVAEWLVAPERPEQLVALWRAMVEEGIGARILGGGTNTIPVAEYLPGITLTLKRMKGVRVNEGEVRVLGGTSLQSLCKELERRNLSGLEGLAGVPGSVAGALVMNAGGRHGNIGNTVDTVDVLEPDGRLQVLSASEAEFEYRKSSLTNRMVLSASLRLPRGDPEEMRAERLKVARRKREVQPLSARSAGCYFKNPDDGRSTGLMIQEAGLKGSRIGGAMSSMHHGNFFVNAGDARGEDFLALADLIRDRLESEHGLELKEEVKLWR